jgi:putative endonuclease
VAHGLWPRQFHRESPENSASNGPEPVEGHSTTRAAGVPFGHELRAEWLMAFGRGNLIMNLQKTARRMAPSLSRGTPFVYMLRLRSGNLYVGCSTDFETRFLEHEQGTACRTTAIDPPEALLFVEIQSDFPTARQRESQIKRWSRAKKQALVNGYYPLLQRLSRSRE